MLIKREVPEGRFQFEQRYEPNYVSIGIFLFLSVIIMFIGARIVHRKVKILWLTLMVLPTIFFACLLVAMILQMIYWKVTGQA